MPFPPINLHQRITSPGRDLFRKKKTQVVPPQTAAVPHNPGDKEKVTRSWPSAHLRSLSRKSSQHQKTKSPTRKEDRAERSWLPASVSQDSCGVVTRSSSVESTAPRGGEPPSRGSPGEKDIRFSLSLTPEAVLVIQKRNLEKQMIAKQQKCCVSADLRHRRVFPSRRTPGGSRTPAGRVEDRQDITDILKISLLNDRYKYDDVEYEEEDADVDETVVLRCKEWLEGVESAAAFGKVDKRPALPHLKGCL